MTIKITERIGTALEEVASGRFNSLERMETAEILWTAGLLQNVNFDTELSPAGVEALAEWRKIAAARKTRRSAQTKASADVRRSCGLRRTRSGAWE